MVDEQAKLEQYRAHKREYQRQYRLVNAEAVRDGKKAYYLAHAEARKAYSREYHRGNTEAAKAYQREWYCANKERVAAYAHEHYQEHREKRLASRRKHYQANRDRLVAYRRKYQHEHIQETRTWWRKKYRTRVARRHGPYAERIDPVEIFDRDKWRCRLCRCKTPREVMGTNEPNAPTLDHIIPVKLGGPHTKANTQCLCRQCNSNKAAKYEGQLAFA